MSGFTLLEPCPFCGSPPEAVEVGLLQAIMCGNRPSCGARMAAATIDRAAAKWNHRASAIEARQGEDSLEASSRSDESAVPKADAQTQSGESRD